MTQSFCPICGKQYSGKHKCQYKVKYKANNYTLGNTIAIFLPFFLISIIICFFNIISGAIFIGITLILFVFSIKGQGSSPVQTSLNQHPIVELAEGLDLETEGAKIEYPEEPTYPDKEDADLIEFEL